MQHPAVRVWATFAALVAAAALVALLLAPLLVPVVLSFVLYALLEPTTSLLGRLGLNRNASALLVLSLTAVAVVGCLTLIVPQLAGQLQDLRGKLPVLRSQLTDWAERLELELERITGVALEGSAVIGDLAAAGSEWARSAVVYGSDLVLATVATVLLLPLLTFFLIRDWKGFRNRALNRLPNRHFELGWLIYHRVARQLQHYVRGVMLQSGIMALITGSGFFLLGLESALLLGIVAGVLNLIPYLGPLLAMVPPVVVILSEPAFAPWLAVSAIGVVALGQLIDNLLVIPGLIAHAVDLHPLVVVVSIIVFGHLFGLMGMILAIPAISSANIVLQGLRQGIRGPVAHEVP